jgi:diguanylate cyclase (GGDEF)-like protein
MLDQLESTRPAASPRVRDHRFPDHRFRRHHAWVAIAAGLALAGVLGALLAAGSVARRDAESSRRDLQVTSAQVASTLQLAIEHEEDLVVNAGAYILGQAAFANNGFARWTAAAFVHERYPEIQALGVFSLVSDDGLAAFAARAALDPLYPGDPDAGFAVVPAGVRPFYCLPAAAQLWNPAVKTPAGLDFCATPAGADFLEARDSGHSSYVPYAVANHSYLSVLTPLYMGGEVPATVDERQVAFAGVVASIVDPAVLLDRAGQGHEDLAVSMRYRRDGSDVSFARGDVAAPTTSDAVDLANGWTVTTRGRRAPSGVVGDDRALGLLVVGSLLSLLLGALVLVLGTGRARALRLVGQRTNELRHQALHDALTGLPNRALIMDRIEQLLARGRRHGTAGAALFIDLDEFKNVNDTLGHAAGDRLLVAVASRLERTLRDVDTIGRMGGDEFVVLLDGEHLQVAPTLVAARLLDVLHQPFDLEGVNVPLVVNASIGIAQGDRSSPGELLRDADVALYQAKGAGKNRYEVFDPEMQTEVSERIELEFDLRSALEAGQFHLVYQPIYHLDDLTVAGVEALLRWDHPSRGVVQPDAFIPILEQTGQIREVGRWVLQEACRQMALWHAQGDTLDISVNISGRQLDHDGIVEEVQDALLASGLEPRALIVEVTETALMRNADSTARRLQGIKDLGVRIAVDDFGTGYSSLAYLQRFPVDCLKIDKSFTNAISTSPESKALIATLVQLGRDLGLATLAEGVETLEQMDHLRGEHVDEAQGFLLARPLDAATLEAELLAPLRTPTPSHPA